MTLQTIATTNHFILMKFLVEFQLLGLDINSTPINLKFCIKVV